MRPTDDFARPMNFTCIRSSPPLLAGVAAWILLAAAVLLSPYPAAGGTEPVRKFRMCADPNNLPFSNERQEGFENKIAELIAGDLEATVRYTWWAQRRGFIRNTLGHIEVGDACACALWGDNRSVRTITGPHAARVTGPTSRTIIVWVQSYVACFRQGRRLLVQRNGIY